MGAVTERGAESGQPSETTATITVVQSVDEEKQFELTNSVIIDGHEYSLPTDLEALSESVIVNKDAKTGSYISYKNDKNIIGDLFIYDNDISSINFHYYRQTDFMPSIIISGVELSSNLTYDDFYNICKENNPKIRTIGETTGIVVENNALQIIATFEKSGQIKTFGIEITEQEDY